MPDHEFTPDDVRAALDAFIDGSTEAAVPMMRGFAELQEKRAARLSDAGARLEERLGEDHPRVMDLRQSSLAADGLRRSLRESAARQPYPPP